MKESINVTLCKIISSFAWTELVNTVHIHDCALNESTIDTDIDIGLSVAMPYVTAYKFITLVWFSGCDTGLRADSERERTAARRKGQTTGVGRATPGSDAGPQSRLRPQDHRHHLVGAMSTPVVRLEHLLSVSMATVSRASWLKYSDQARVHGTLGDAKCVTEILGWRGKKKEVSGSHRI